MAELEPQDPQYHRLPKEEAVEKPVKKKSSPNLVSMISLIFLVFVIVAIIALKYYQPEFETGDLIWPIVGLGIVILAIIFGPTIINIIMPAKKVEGGLPQPITDEQAFEMVFQAMNLPRYLDKIASIESEGSESMGEGVKSEVYHILFVGKMRNPRNKYLYVINKHFPKNKKKVKVFKEFDMVTEKQIFTLKNSVAASPEAQPDIEERKERNLVTGVETEYKRVSHAKKDIKVHESKAEALE
jgi:hypothetical protein